MKLYPGAVEFLERKYGLKIGADEQLSSLKQLVDRHGLVPAQILFMEIQLNERAKGVRSIKAKEAKAILEARPETRLLDVRESWEMELAQIRGAQPLNAAVLDELLKDAPKTVPILLFCHFGIRSMDAATFLVDHGFSQVNVIQGGIDAWSLEVDPLTPRYDKAYC